MTIEELYNDVRVQFPEFVDEADKDCRWRWGDSFSQFIWFESLANVVNVRMRAGKDFNRIKALFEFLGARFNYSSDDTRDCIDTSFVENLFWQVEAKSAAKYWNAMPGTLKRLYQNFHQKTPL